MPTPVLSKISRWRESGKGLKSQLSADLKRSVSNRDDIDDLLVAQSMSRGDRQQNLRLAVYSSIDVDHDQLFAGKIEGTLKDAHDKLLQMGYRNNPTAYIEVTEEHGPDDGSYAKQTITESSANIDRPYLTNHPALFQREKRQVHVCVWKVDDEVHFLAHDEISAWLQPMLHVTIVDSKARIGVREFRNDWYDEFGEELPGREDVSWPTAH